MTPRTESLLRQAAASYRAGDLAGAEAVYRSVLASEPDLAEVNHNLGIVLRRLDRHHEALPFLQRALARAPGQGQFWASCIEALIHVGQTEAARRLLQQGRAQYGLAGPAVDALAGRLGAAPTHAGAPQNAVQDVLGLLAQGRFGETEVQTQHYLERHPEDGFMWKVLGIARKNLGKDAGALAAMDQAVRYSAGDFEAHYNLGNALFEAGKREAAVASFRSALALKPDHAESHNNLGQALLDLGRQDEAVQELQVALRLAPALPAAHNNLGNYYLGQKRYSEAEGCYREALRLAPDSAETNCNLGVAFYEQSMFGEAEAFTRRALDIRPSYSRAHLNLGNIHQSLGRFDDALACYRAAVAAEPQLAENYDNMLFTLNYHPDKSAEDIFAAYREFDEHLGVPLRSEWRPHGNDRNGGRRLRIGYVSPDFRRHVVRHFLEPLLAHHDRRDFEVFAYAELLRDDDATARFRAYVDHWLPTLGMSDEALAERIRADGIDILVDLAGHTTGNRLLVFARKPAPVSVSWLGYGYTTGLSAIDYLLTDGACAPEGSEHLFAEIPWRLKTPAFAYRPDEGLAEANELPALKRGHVTFGTLTRAVRINHRVVRVWSAILRRLPEARLAVDSHNYRAVEMQEALAAQFAAHGIGRERLDIGFHSPPWDVLRGMDIGLDCFPHNSGTTLFESLYLGVPYVTLAGRPSVGRLGSSILEGVGHAEWIARTEEEYIDKAVALAGDLPKLAATRANLRAEMQASPLMDEAGFARKVEAAYREMFKRWAEGAPA